MQLFKQEIETTNLDLFCQNLISKQINHQSFSVLPITLNEIYLSYTTPAIAQNLEKFTYLVPDGVPLLWLERLAAVQSSRIYGPDLMRTLCNQSQKTPLTHFFYGGKNQTVINKLLKNLKYSYPNLKIAGYYLPPFTPPSTKEKTRIINTIRQAHPDIIWVGLGSQKQIYWVNEYRQLFPNISFIAVGAAFDFLSGTKKQAPLWIRRHGFEWAFRLLSEPRRLAGRYIGQLPYTAIIYFKEIIRLLNLRFFYSHLFHDKITQN